MSAPSSLPSLLLASQFYTACGTVTVDPRARKWLGIRDTRIGPVHLPRGRKDWGERLEATAERETFEEAGFRTRLLPCYVPTRATPPNGADKPGHPYHAELAAARFEEQAVADGAHLVEPFALFSHVSYGTSLAFVSFFLGVGDSTTPYVPPEASGQMADESFESMWFDYDYIPPNMQAEYVPIVAEGIRLAKDMAERDGVEEMLKRAKAHWEPTEQIN